MTTLRDHLERLDAADELLHVEDRLHWADQLPAVAVEAVEVNGPAVVFEDGPGRVRLASGVYSGPDRTRVRDGAPWRRLAMGLGQPPEISYIEFLESFARPGGGTAPAVVDRDGTEPVDTDLYSLGLPAVGTQGQPSVSLGVLVLEDDQGTRWAPARGTVRGGQRIRMVVPAAAVDHVTARRPATLALGVPAAVHVAAIARWTGDTGVDRAIDLAGALDDIEVVDTDRGILPADVEVLIEGEVWHGGDAGSFALPAGTPEAWEAGTDTEVVKCLVSGVETREAPVVPFSPTGHPIADDRQLLSFTESARLFHRVNNYWGISPVEWIALPAETGLGICVVAAEVLYAGFEWQLANTMFTFSGLFDKVLLLDTTVSPLEYGRAFDDLWVKAHPSHNWTFTEPDAPAAAVPAYRADDTTGSRLYIDATWDPTWDEEFIAPRVTFEDSFPERVREFVRDHWTAMGFTSPLVGEHEPEQ